MAILETYLTQIQRIQVTQIFLIKLILYIDRRSSFNHQLQITSAFHKRKENFDWDRISALTNILPSNIYLFKLIY